MALAKSVVTVVAALVAGQAWAQQILVSGIDDPTAMPRSPISAPIHFCSPICKIKTFVVESREGHLGPH
jgi:hypothetical protein